MKLTEKDLRKLIKEELEGSEDTRDAIESNLHDEIIVRYFEGVEKGELTEEQIDSEIERLKEEKKVSGHIPRLAKFIFRNQIVNKVMGLIAPNRRYASQLLQLIAQKLMAMAGPNAGNLAPEKVFLPAFLAVGKEAKDATDTGFESEEDETPEQKPGLGAAAAGDPGGRSQVPGAPDVKEEIINKVIENLFNSNQNK